MNGSHNSDGSKVNKKLAALVKPSCMLETPKAFLAAYSLKNKLKYKKDKTMGNQQETKFPLF